MSAGAAALRPPAAPSRSEVRIVALDRNGRGIAAVDGRAVRVDGALEGERVVIDVVRRRRRYDEAKLVEVLEPSPQRARPSCAYFHLCGGCRFQHLALEAQREMKEHAFKAALSAHGLAPPQRWYAPITGPDTGYRRKARFGVKYVPGKGGALVGFREKRGGFVADIKSCEVLVPSAGSRVDALRELVSGLNARDRIPQIEIAAGDDATALIFRHLDPLTQADSDALKGFARENDLRVYLQPGGIDTIAPLWPQHPPPLRYRIPEFNLELAFQPVDFIQVNETVNLTLVSRAIQWLDAGPVDRILDLYCGIGNFSLALARTAGQVMGVEANSEMVVAARRNAETNAITNASFQVANLEDDSVVANVLSQVWTGMLLDPPRSGAAPVVDKLSHPYPKRIVYVSCNPESFAMDAAALVTVHGYQLDRAGIVDMFPHTGHVEVIGCFSWDAD